MKAKQNQTTENGKSGKFWKRPGLVKAKNKLLRLSIYEFPVFVGGKEYIAYRDSGSEMSFVQQKLFPDLKITGNIEIFGINDEHAVQLPTAVIHITSPSFGTQEEIPLEVGILPHMKWELLIGNALFDSSDIADLSKITLRASRLLE